MNKFKGFTESEIAAALFSKQAKALSDSAHNKSVDDDRHIQHKRKIRDRSDSRSKHSQSDRARRNQRERSRSESRSRVTVDKFGREIINNRSEADTNKRQMRRSSDSPYRDSDIHNKNINRNRSAPPSPRRRSSMSPSRSRSRSRSSSRSTSSYRSEYDYRNPNLAKLPPPPDPINRFHDNRGDGSKRKKIRHDNTARYDDDERRHRSRCDAEGRNTSIRHNDTTNSARGSASSSSYQYSHTRRSHSRSRSRNRSHHHRSRSISSSRLRDRRRDDAATDDDVKWIRDRHTIDEPGLLQPPKNYRPLSPQWKSRAGGVALMKKKSTTSSGGTS